MNNIVGISEGKRGFESPSHRWEHNIKMEIREIPYKGVKWMQFPRNRGE
jgi:hypothetical protein